MKIINNITKLFRGRKEAPSLLAYSIITFTNEGWLDGINRQGRLLEYLHYNA